MTWRWRLRLQDLRARLRRPPVAVLWGGRACDYQLGSHRDLVRARRLRRIAELRRSQQPLVESMRAFNASMHKAVLAFNDAFTPTLRATERAMREFGEAHARAQGRVR